MVTDVTNICLGKSSTDWQERDSSCLRRQGKNEHSPDSIERYNR